MHRVKFLRSQFKKTQRESRALSKSNGREICGLIIDNGHFFELIQLGNKIKRGGGFAFYFKEVRDVCKMARLCGHIVVGSFHSHPVGLAEPGPSDVQNAMDDSIMLIYDVMGRSAKLWRIKNGKARQRSFSLI
ncbi:MAG TPA: Mov34/MPN/PAD-1 family protein [Verrucomicrobiae bacterium]|jgi:proteasome lid subunit RPN8/RPN11|nr:Mov34/MPN/PAD-1 family protein [Verrucomicrobiae bacterium]